MFLVLEPYKVNCIFSSWITFIEFPPTIVLRLKTHMSSFWTHSLPKNSEAWWTMIGENRQLITDEPVDSEK